MPRLKYRDYRPGKLAKAMIQLANEILEEYTEQGFKLTLRQLYYQFVAREYLPNTDKQYARLGDIVSRAREAGMIDWDHLQDRGRNVQSFPHWDKPGDIIRDCVHSYHRDLWHDQEVRVEVWVEKDALSDVVGKAARRWDVPYFANKGYLSTSAAWDAGHNRFLQWKQTHDQDTIIIHLGDHDPSGIQMTEDIERRVKLFSSAYDDLDAPQIRVHRIALNLDQIERLNLPPNPAKQSDSRYLQYVEKFGLEDSWELDALEPSHIVELIDSTIRGLVDFPKWTEQHRIQEEHRDHLRHISGNWSKVTKFLGSLDK